MQFHPVNEEYSTLRHRWEFISLRYRGVLSNEISIREFSVYEIFPEMRYGKSLRMEIMGNSQDRDIGELYM